MAAPHPRRGEVLGDFSTTPRVLPIAVFAVVVGAIGSCAALALLRLIDFFTNLFFFGRFSTSPALPADHRLGVGVILIPVLGALLIGLIARFGSEKIRGHGIPEAIESVLLRGSRVEPRLAILKPISSAISIGSGGPFGAEGPIIMTGGAFGSLLAQLFALTAAERKTLLVAGAAAGMSATFGTPVAAVLLAVELLLFEWKPRSFVPVALASASAAIGRHYLIGDGALFPVPLHTYVTDPTTVLGCGAAGLAAGLVATTLTALVYFFEDAFLRLKRIHWMWWPAIGAIAIGVGGYICPRALGVGYVNIAELLSGEMAMRAVLVLVFVKAMIWSVSLGSGTSGGVLAPLLTIGAAAGALLSPLLPYHGPGFWALVCMGASLAGAMRSPLTAIVFSIELTHDLTVFLPLLVAASVAHLFTVLLLRRSILTEKIARRGFHITREYAIDPLEILRAFEVMTPNVECLAADLRVADAAASIANSSPVEQKHYVVVDGGKMVGIVSSRTLHRAINGSPGATGTVRDLAAGDPIVAYPDEPLRVVVYRMSETGHTWLPVVERDDPSKLAGVVTLKDMLKARARHAEEERRRERVLPIRLTMPSFGRSRAR